jgi:RimJ/RimL family protein N-acetyltransferase
MFNQQDISIEDHRQWYINKSKQHNQHLLIFEDNKTPQGFVSFSIRDGNIADWGFYKSPSSPKGTGYKLGQSALRHAFEILKLHKVNGQVIGFNENSLKFHLALGFIQEGVIRESYFDGTSYHAIIHFGLLKDEWNRS